MSAVARARATAALALVVAALAGWTGGAAVAAGDDDPVLARAFEVRYRPLADAADLVAPVLSADGQVTIKPRLKTLVVEDRASVLTKIAALLESVDLPPRNVEVRLSLFLGTDRREQRPGGRLLGSDGISTEVRGVIDTLGDFTKWTAYEPLGSRSVTGVEGDPVRADLSDEYSVSFVVDGVHESRREVVIRDFKLEKMSFDADGRPITDAVLSTGMVVPMGRLHVVVAAKAPDSTRALFLTLQADGR